MSSSEDAFYSEAGRLQQSLLEINALRERVRNYRESEKKFADLANAEKAKLDSLVEETRPKVIQLMQAFLAISDEPPTTEPTNPVV